MPPCLMPPRQGVLWGGTARASLQEHVGILVPAGTTLVVRGMYGGVARVPLELEGLGEVVEWSGV